MDGSTLLAPNKDEVHSTCPHSLEGTQNCSDPSASNVFDQQRGEGEIGDNNLVNTFEQEDIPPDGGYGWVCTICLFAINAHTWGVNSAWAIFLARYLSHSTFPGASQLDYALIGGLSISQCLLVTPLVAVSIRRLGTRTTLLIGTVLVFLALFCASYASQIWHLFLTQGCCFGYGMGFLYLPATAVLPQWFSKRRSLALGIASSGAGLGGLAYNLIAGRAIETVGLQWTYRILAFCTLGVNLVSSILLKDRNLMIKPNQSSFNMREYLRVEVVLILIWGVLTELGYIILLYSLPSYAISIGLSQTQGSIVSAVLNLGLGLGRPVIGYCSDSFGRINIATVMTALCGIFCLAVWIPASSFAVLTIFALLSGTCCGIFWNTMASVTTEVVGLKRLPSALGMIYIPLILPTTFAEPIALQLISASGYLSGQVFVGLMYLLAATSTWLLRSWQINEVEKKAREERQQEQPDRQQGTGLRDAQQQQAIALADRTESTWARQAGRSQTRPSGHDFWLTPRKLFMRTRV